MAVWMVSTQFYAFNKQMHKYLINPPEQKATLREREFCFGVGHYTIVLVLLGSK